MKARVRLVLLAAGAAALVAFANVKEAPEQVRARETPAEPADPVPQEDKLDFGAAFVRQPLPEVGHAFQTKSWAPPTAPGPRPEPPKPVAPPIPYTFLGRMDSDEAQKVFLRRGKELVVAAERETLDGGWRLETIGPDGLVLTYLPLNQQKILSYK